LLHALDAGALDLEEEGEESIIYTEPKDLAKVRDELKESKVEIEEAELSYVPSATVMVKDKETAGKIMRLMDALDDLDDVTNTYTNFEIPEDLV
jgi:transcriptional/translational regulatory protein YebC/TACO1